MLSLASMAFSTKVTNRWFTLPQGLTCSPPEKQRPRLYCDPEKKYAPVHSIENSLMLTAFAEAQNLYVGDFDVQNAYPNVKMTFWFFWYFKQTSLAFSSILDTLGSYIRQFMVLFKPDKFKIRYWKIFWENRDFQIPTTRHIFTSIWEKQKFIILKVFVDEFSLISNWNLLISPFMTKLSGRFDVKIFQSTTLINRV